MIPLSFGLASAVSYADTDSQEACPQQARCPVDGVFLVLIGVIRDIRSHWWSSVEPGGVGLGGSAAVDPYDASSAAAALGLAVAAGLLPLPLSGGLSAPLLVLLVGTLAGLVSLIGLAKA